MGKIFITEFVSLDGVFQAPGPDGSGFKYEGWTFPYHSEEFMTFKGDELKITDSLLLGRITYEGFAEAWPKHKGDWFSDKFNSMPKYVVSKTLKKADWTNSHIISENIVEELKKLEGTLAVHGSGTLARFLLENNLADELTLMVYPVILGTGKRLFADMNKVGLKLVESRSIANGIMILKYIPEKS